MVNPELLMRMDHLTLARLCSQSAKRNKLGFIRALFNLNIYLRQNGPAQ